MGRKMPGAEVGVEKVPATVAGRAVTARRLTVRSRLPMPASRCWANLRSPSLLDFVARGLLRFRPASPWPAYWVSGQRYAVAIYLFGWLRLPGLHHLLIESIDEQRRVLETVEWDSLVKLWNHRITVAESRPGIADYEDAVLIHAGWLTLPVLWFATWFYRHRHRRWQLVAENDLEFPPK